jgi:hypothetical protein
MITGDARAENAMKGTRGEIDSLDDEETEQKAGWEEGLAHAREQEKKRDRLKLTIVDGFGFVVWSLLGQP